jgi:hypothetical protein
MIIGISKNPLVNSYLHCTIYDSHMPMMKKLPSDTIQLLCKLINVNNLLYTYANVMQQIDNSLCGVFIITYATNIAFGFDFEKFQYVLTQM